MKTICALLIAFTGLMIGTARADDPKGYRITLGDSKIGTIALEPGDYKLLIHQDDAKAQLMNTKTGNVIDLPGAVQNADQKFQRTEVHSERVDGVNQIHEIRIGGTRFRVDFRKAS